MTDHLGTRPPHVHQAFGLVWSSDIPLHDFDVAAASATHRTPDIIVEETASLPATREGLIPVNRGAVCAGGVRFRWGREVSFDTYGADRVFWQAGADWTGRMPQPFFSTLTAILLGWRGMLPIHGSAVEIDGLGYLICGPSGAGKSTLAAGLVALGAKLISDDLSVVTEGRDGTTLSMVRGRPGMRLVPEIADYFAQSANPIASPERRDHKFLVRPAMVPVGQEVPLVGLIVRVAGAETATVAHHAGLIKDQIFRKRWMSALPRRRARAELARQIGTAVPIFSMPRSPLGDRQDFLDQAGAAMSRLANTTRLA